MDKPWKAAKEAAIRQALIEALEDACDLIENLLSARLTKRWRALIARAESFQ